MVTIDHRLDRLNEPHVRPLMELIADIRKRGVEVPNVDPNDGGIDARVLFLLESPGPKAVCSNFISRDNPDPSARNMSASLDLAKLDRKDVVLWNVVPHCVSTRDENRNERTSDIRNAAPNTQRFIELLPRLQVVVFCGRKAQLAVRWLVMPAGVTILKTAHPGGMSYNRPHLRKDIHHTFSKVAGLLCI